MDEDTASNKAVLEDATCNRQNMVPPNHVVGVGASAGGLGVGLTLVKALVEEHGGRVEAYSEGHGTGCTFRVWLPILDNPSDASVEVDEEMTSSSKGPSVPRRIVLIEDIDDSRRMLTTLLELDGHTVYACADGESGVHAIHKHRPDAALVDIGLPGMDGYEVARQTRSNPDCAETKLVALTGYGQKTDIDKAIAAGFNSHLVKPIDPNELTKIL